MENKVIFVNGLNVYTPSENAPDWVKADMVINPTKLVKWLEQNDQYLKEGKHGLEVRLQIKQSAQGKAAKQLRGHQQRRPAAARRRKGTNWCWRSGS